MNAAQQFSQAEQCFADGQLKEAANLCKEILDTHPEFARGYYLMGALFNKTGNFESAVKFADLAIKYGPANPDFYVQKGYSLLCLKRYEEAKSVLAEANHLQPQSAFVLMLLGDAAMAENDFDSAADCFKQALTIEKFPELYEHMGICQHAKGERAEAEENFRQLIALYPESAKGYFNLGKLIAEKGDLPLAEQHLVKAIALDERSHEAYLVLANLCAAQSKTDPAVMWATQALRLKPDYLNAYLFLGAHYMQQEMYSEAENLFEAALRLDVQSVLALQSYAQILLHLGREAEALEYIERYLEKVPNDPTMRYFQAVCRKETVPMAPNEYVSQLFDAYAERFDHHLQEQLGYRIPAKIATLIQKILPEAGLNAEGLSLLDLGCGTGLGAQAMQSFTSFRVGVDLSAGMIAKAKAKKLYDDTHVGDVVSYLRDELRRYDLITAMDVLVYIGDLEAMFAAVRQVLSEGGIFALSIESGDDAPPFVLRPSARYAHARAYVEEMIAKYGFVTRYFDHAVIREEKGAEMPGYIVILQKPLSH